MSFHSRAGARLSRSMLSRKSCAGTETMTSRPISWMAFEMPNPALYQKPPSVQPKHPLTTDEATAEADGAPPTSTATAASTASKAQAGKQEAPASVKTNPATSAPQARAPLSQVQKRSITTGPRMQGAAAAAAEPEYHEEEHYQQAHAMAEPGRPQDSDPTPVSPTLRLCLRGHPATWPVAEPEYPMTRKQFIEWIAEGELISKGKLPRC